jgi:hypothetical protein
MMLRFISSVAFGVAAAFLVVASVAFSPSAITSLAFARNLARARRGVSRARYERARGKEGGRRLGRELTAATGTRRRGRLPHRHLALEAPPAAVRDRSGARTRPLRRST